MKRLLKNTHTHTHTHPWPSLLTRGLKPFYLPTPAMPTLLALFAEPPLPSPLWCYDLTAASSPFIDTHTLALPLHAHMPACTHTNMHSLFSTLAACGVCPHICSLIIWVFIIIIFLFFFLIMWCEHGLWTPVCQCCGTPRSSCWSCGSVDPHAASVASVSGKERKSTKMQKKPKTKQ